MKKLFVVATLLIASALPVSAETVRTCHSAYGAGEICGESTSTVTEQHKIIEYNTGASDNQIIKIWI